MLTDFHQKVTVEHLRREHDVTTIVAEMDARNAASIAVAVRLGLHEVAREDVDDERTGAKGTELRYEGPAKHDLDALRARVAADPELAGRLRAIDPEHFVAEATRIARELGYDVKESDLDEAIAGARRAWMMRWIR